MEKFYIQNSMKNNISEINHSPYSLNRADKSKLLNKFLRNLTLKHYKYCDEYKKMINAIGFDFKKKFDFKKIPFLPVRLFKMMDLMSVDKPNIVKTMTSSGTSGQQVSKIYLDKDTALDQTRVLTKIVSSFIGKKRVPMIIIDSEDVLKNRKLFSARGAGILGFSIFGSKKLYALDKNMNLKIDELQKFIKDHEGENFLLFGFTFIIWQYFYKKLFDKKINLDLSNSTLIHGGGWKKLINQAVSSKVFREKLFSTCKISNVHDYYGMVEQTGSINIECSEGYLHPSIYSDIIVRNPINFDICDYGQEGLIQVISIIPSSYPGHSLLTDDIGVIYGEDDCKCGRKGKYFRVKGRIKSAEIRGCSDTFES
tara:strand:- start:5704 stop:6807 length:1104 start_codon:yes stop_codon:yes gene_type:complete